MTAYSEIDKNLREKPNLMGFMKMMVEKDEEEIQYATELLNELKEKSRVES